jgi:cation diffusion facilitator family transporter
MSALSREKQAAARLSVVASALLIVLKLAVGLSTGSVAVLSEAVHSATDLVAALVAYFAVRASDLPPDDDHPYGHGKLESLSGLIESLLVLAAAAWIAVEAVGALFYGTTARRLGLAMAVMALSAVVNSLVATSLARVARRTDSAALLADSQHLMTDVWTSLGVLIGLILVQLTGEARFDPLVALLVAALILSAAFRIARDAVGALIDGTLPDDEVRTVERVLKGDGRVLDYHKLRTRKAGSSRHMDVHIQVDDDLSLKAAHALTEELEDAIREALPNVEIMIHTEPYEEERRHRETIPH